VEARSPLAHAPLVAVNTLTGLLGACALVVGADSLKGGRSIVCNACNRRFLCPRILAADHL
jgi:predicted hydrolase (HD superfamily)